MLKKDKIQQTFIHMGAAAPSEFFYNQIGGEWLNTQEASKFLAISENALRIMVHREQVQVHRIGRRLRFKRSDLVKLFE